MRFVTHTGMLISLTVNVFSCGDPQFSGNEKKIQSTERKPKEKPATETKAIEPSVIIGAYLTCQNVENPNPNHSSYGCAMMSQNDTKLIPPADLALDFVAQSDLKFFGPKLQTASSPFHVIFEIPNFLSQDLIFGAGFRPSSGTAISRQAIDMPFHIKIKAPNTPVFTVDRSGELKSGTVLRALNVPFGHTVHWTYTNDLSETLNNPTCDSKEFGEPNNEIVLNKNIRFRAIVCSPKAALLTGGLRLSSLVRELEFTIPVNKCACRK
jgi:hypothetical protein